MGMAVGVGSAAHVTGGPGNRVPEAVFSGTVRAAISPRR